MRLDHLLSREKEEVRAAVYCSVIKECWRSRLAASEQQGTDFLAAIRPGATPVPIPNTMVKARAADGTLLETVRESRWLPGLKKREGQMQIRCRCSGSDRYRQGRATTRRADPISRAVLLR